MAEFPGIYLVLSLSLHNLWEETTVILFTINVNIPIYWSVNNFNYLLKDE